VINQLYLLRFSKIHMLAEDLNALHGALQPLDGVTKLHWKHYVNTTSRSKITSVKYFVINENSLVTNYESIHGRSQ